METMKEWLTLLPRPSTESYQITPGSPIASTEMASGFARQRRIYKNPPDMFGMIWDMSQKEYALFEAFFEYDLNAGANYFKMGHWVGNGWVEGVFRFKGHPPFSVSNLGQTDFKVSATLERQKKNILSEEAYNLIQEEGYEVSSERLHKYINVTLPLEKFWDRRIM